jgi:hypothetical protein
MGSRGRVRSSWVRILMRKQEIGEDIRNNVYERGCFICESSRCTH